jgi:hypothetical protein
MPTKNSLPHLQILEENHAPQQNHRHVLGNSSTRPQKHQNTLLYVQLEEALFQGEQDYISKIARTEKEICSLVEAGFEYVTEFDGTKIFRKRKL